MSNSIEVKPVKSLAERRIFLDFPRIIYQNDPLWVPPILSDLQKRLDPTQGVYFKRGGMAEFFIAWRHNTPVGTICIGEDPVINQQRGRKDCIFGFFESIDDRMVSRALFDQAAVWGKRHNLDSLYGPFNLDYEDSYGILVEGWDRPPVLLCAHNPPYYQALVEDYGFKKARGDGLAFEVRLDQDNREIERIHHLAERLRKRRNFTIRQANLADWDNEVERVFSVINRALEHLTDFIPWQREAFYESLAQFKKIVDPEFILLAEANGEVIGWFPGIPNLNEALIHANGLHHPWDYLKLAWYMRKHPECLAVKSVLVLPEYWDTGVSVLLFDEMVTRLIGKGYSWVDLSVTAEDNPDTPILAERVGARIYKRYRIYRYQLSN